MEIVTGYNRKCKDSIGGVSKVWICKYQKYSRSQIVTDGNILVSFPDSFLHSFESLEIPNATETQETGEGGKFYNQSISLVFSGADKTQLELLNYLEYRILILDNNGVYRIYGMYNGLESSGLTYETGGAKNSFNGFRITFTGKEDKKSLFVNNPFNYLLLQNNDYFIFQNTDLWLIEN